MDCSIIIAFARSPVLFKPEQVRFHVKVAFISMVVLVANSVGGIVEGAGCEALGDFVGDFVGDLVGDTIGNAGDKVGPVVGFLEGVPGV